MSSPSSVPPPSPKAAVEDFSLPKTRSSAALGEIKTKLSGALGEARQSAGDIKIKLSGKFDDAKQTLGEVKGRVGQKMEEVVDVLPQLPAIPVPPSPGSQVAKRGEQKLKLNMLQETRRRDEPMYDPKGIRFSKATERLILRTIFYLISFATMTFLILSFVFQLGIGQASQAAIWAISATFLGGALALNTRIPQQEPNRWAGFAGIVVTGSTFASFIVFCIGTTNPDLDQVAMGLGVFVTLLGFIAAALWTYNLWFPSKRAIQIREEEMKEFGAFRSFMVPKEQGTLARVERGTPQSIQNLHMACNVVTVILWYVFAVLIVFFTFDINSLVSDASKFTPPPGDRVPVINITVPAEPPPFDLNSSSPTAFPTSSPTFAPTLEPTLPGETRRPSFYPSPQPSAAPFTSEPTTSPSASPTTSTPTSSPSFTPSHSPSQLPSAAPTTSSPTANPTAAPSYSPSSSSPTVSPSTSPTTSAPSTSPSQSPTTSSPSQMPSHSPTTSVPTRSPSTSPTHSPSKNPTTSKPSVSPSRSPTTSSPSTSPSHSPTTSKPTTSPSQGVTLVPTASPTSSRPTASPTSSSPTPSPTTSRPSASPTSSVPTRSPTTSIPTKSPTSSQPTPSPTTSFPTGSPTVSSPTRSPTTKPSKSPSVSSPTRSPTVSKPTMSPSTPRPSRAPSTSRPSRSPTNRPTTRSPTSKAPTASPSASPTASPTRAFVPIPNPPPRLPEGTVLAGGTMHFVCEGNSSARPVVLLEHDVGATLDVWAWVQSALAANSTYVCSYSRRGYGYSSPGTRPRTPQVSVVELKAALNALNITSPIVYVGHGWGGFQMRRFYHVHPDMVAAMVFVDAYTPQCFMCDANEKKADDDRFGLLESLLPTGVIRALAYSGAAFPGPSGQCVPRLPETWGEHSNPARSRLLAALLSPSLWANALLENSDMPQTCALAAQAPGNSPQNRIAVPMVSITAENGIFKGDPKCGKEIKHAGGGTIDGKTRAAPSWGVEVEDANHYTLICDQRHADRVSQEIMRMVDLVRTDSKLYTVIKTTKTNWVQARSLCQSRGERLVSIKSESNQQDVEAAVSSANVNDDLWLGATDQAVQGQFRWGDGTLVNSRFSNWASGEPSSSFGRDCVGMVRTNRKWQARLCSETKFPICERDGF